MELVMPASLKMLKMPQNRSKSLSWSPVVHDEIDKISVNSTRKLA